MARWTPFRLVLVGALVAFGLAACSLIPDQDIGDVFGIDGTPATLTQVPVDAGSAALSTAAFTSCEDAPGTHCAVLTTTQPFADPDLPGIVARIIAGLSVDAGLRPTIDITMDEPAILPSEVNVSSFALALTLRDVTTGKTATFSGEVTAEPAVAFEASTPLGRYVASDVDPLSLTVTVSGSTMSTVSDILTGGGDNTAAGVVVLTVEEGNIATIEVTLTSEGTTASF